MRSLVPVTLMMLLAVTFCGTAVGADVPEKRTEEAYPTALQGSFATVEELTEAVLDALAGKDRATLRRLAVTRGEFIGIVWPRLDAARPERNLTPEFVWRQHLLRHQRDLNRLVLDEGGAAYSLVRVELDGGVRDFGTFVLHEDPVVIVRTADGGERELVPFSSVIEQDGRYKAYSFIVD